LSTILLVDDDPSVRKSVGDMLGRSGYGVSTAADGGAAMVLLQERSDIDLIIADYRMPGMDGLALVRQVKERSPALPAVIMTGYGDLESYLCAAGLGVVRYIAKPVGLRELMQTVRDAVADGPRGTALRRDRDGHT